ncbi:MAG TPA: protein kinase, partial [Polyangiaceae bacterium]|jgi:serine/threonine-protein kinase
VGYIAPEQARAEHVDRRADIWSAGVVLWESLTGARLFKGETDAATLGLTLQGQIPSASSRRVGIPAELETVLLRALQRDPALRYQTAGAMRADLEVWLARAGFSRDARVVSGLMKELFASEIIEQQRLVSVLMARSDCTPPAPASNRSPSSTSALYMSVPQAGATSADLTRMNAQMEELGLRHRRAFRSMFALIGVFLLMACATVSLSLIRANSGPGRSAVASSPAAARLAQPAEPHSERAAPAAAPVALPAPVPAVPAASAASAAVVLLPQPSAVKAAHPLPAARAAKVQSAATPVLEPAPAAAVVASAPSASKADVAPSFGFLTIDTSPWSQVSVGGRNLGQTPLIGVKLPSGTQVLSLKNPELGIETSYPVTIETGKTTVRRIGIE